MSCASCALESRTLSPVQTGQLSAFAIDSASGDNGSSSALATPAKSRSALRPMTMARRLRFTKRRLSYRFRRPLTLRASRRPEQGQHAEDEDIPAPPDPIRQRVDVDANAGRLVVLPAIEHDVDIVQANGLDPHAGRRLILEAGVEETLALNLRLEFAALRDVDHGSNDVTLFGRGVLESVVGDRVRADLR